MNYFAYFDPYSKTGSGFANTKEIICFESHKERKEWLENCPYLDCGKLSKTQACKMAWDMKRYNVQSNNPSFNVDSLKFCGYRFKESEYQDKFENDVDCNYKFWYVEQKY